MFASQIKLRYNKRIKRLVDSFRYSIKINVILVTYSFTTINNNDIDYYALLDNRELMQIYYPFKYKNFKIINIQTSHEFPNYIQKTLKQMM